MINLDFLEQVDVLKDLNDFDLSALLDCCEEKEFKRGEKIFSVTEEPDNLWLVMKGQVDLRRGSEESEGFDGNTISTISDGMTFGWSSLVAPYKYRLSSYCSSRTCKVVKVDKKCLIALFERNPRLGYMVMSRLLSVIGMRFDRLEEERIRRRGEELMNKW